MSAPLPKEALAYFDSKNLKPAFHYQDVWREESVLSFTVAKAVKIDILEDIRASLRLALSEGITFQQFKKDLIPTLQKKGWWGIREMIDPETGEIDLVKLGSPRRLQIIWDANIRSAHAAGQWARIQRTKKSHPYLVYELGPSVEHRKEHKAWAGIILPVDHSFWITHFAPNGWGCKCRIRQISQRTYDLLMQKTDKDGKKLYSTKAPKIIYKSFKNRRTGITEDIPEGIDAGWNTNPGYLRQIGLDREYAGRALKLDGYTQAQAAELFISPIRKAEIASWVARMNKTDRPGGELKTIGILGGDEIDFMSKLPRHEIEETLIVVEGKLLSQAGKSARHKKRGDALTVKQWESLPELLQKPQHILWLQKGKQLIYLVPNHPKKTYIKIVVESRFKSKRTKKAGWQARLNMIRSAYIVSADDVKSLIGKSDYDKIK